MNSFFWFYKKICKEYQLNKEDEYYTKMNGPSLAKMAAYHWSHMTDLEKEPYRRASILDAMQEEKRCESPSYIS